MPYRLASRGIRSKMPPAPSQKGTGKKASGIVRQRSRNTTPSAGPPQPPGTANLPPVETIETEFLELRLESVRPITYEDLAESSASNAAIIPDSKSLDGMVARLNKLHDIIERRGQFCDRGMRLVASQRKMQYDDLAAASREEDRVRDDDNKKANKKKRKANDSLAPQDASAGKSSSSPLFISHILRACHRQQLCRLRLFAPSLGIA